MAERAERVIYQATRKPRGSPRPPRHAHVKHGYRAAVEDALHEKDARNKRQQGAGGEHKAERQREIQLVLFSLVRLEKNGDTRTQRCEQVRLCPRKARILMRARWICVKHPIRSFGK